MSLMAASLLGGCASDNLKISPVNPDASQEARQLLEFLYSIRGRYTLAGQHNFISDPGRYDSVVFAMTGKHPVVWGSDFSFNAQGDNVRDYHHCGPMNLTSPWGECLPNNKSTEELRQGLVEEIKARARRRQDHHPDVALLLPCGMQRLQRFVDLDMEEPSPATGMGGTDHRRHAPQPAMEGTDEHGHSYLRQLRDARIPILWRPYHEMNGVWFWWCAKPGENGFKKLWIMTYDYLTRVHGLDNLLWVWNTNAPRDKQGDEAGPYADYYPGSEYVDILAADVYHRDYKQSHHDDLKPWPAENRSALAKWGSCPIRRVTTTKARLDVVHGLGVFHQQPEKRQVGFRRRGAAYLRRSAHADTRPNRLLRRNLPVATITES